MSLTCFCEGWVLSHFVLWLRWAHWSHTVCLPAVVVQVQGQLGTSLVYIRCVAFLLNADK